MILRNFGMAFSLSCLTTHLHRLQGSSLNYGKTLSSQVVRNLDVAGHTLKQPIFSAPNVTWMSLNKIQSMFLLPSFYYLISFITRLFMEHVVSGEWRIDPHDIPHFCYHKDARHDENQDKEFDEVEGLFSGFLIEQVTISHISHARWPLY